jgi:hypothetical protein
VLVVKFGAGQGIEKSSLRLTKARLYTFLQILIGHEMLDCERLLRADFVEKVLFRW